MNEVELNRHFLETGDTDSFTRIFKRYYHGVFKAAFRILRNPQDAEEVANDTFSKAFQGRENIVHPEKLPGWLYKTAQNVAIDRRRAALSRADHLPEGARFVSLDALPHAEQAIGSASIDAARQTEQEQARRERLARLLRLLSDID